MYGIVFIFVINDCTFSLSYKILSDQLDIAHIGIKM